MKQYFTRETYEAGSRIFIEGDQADALYVIHSGTVEVIKNRDGVDMVVAVLEKGDVFGEMALIDRHPRSATVVAATDAECFRMNIDDFRARVNALDPLLQKVFTTLSTHLRHTTELLVEQIKPPIV